MATFDVVSAVAEFSADIARTTFELPHMTTGQRKTAKKLLEQFPELVCESYGFGAERQLHLFKKSYKEEPRSPGRSTAASSEASKDSSSSKGSPAAGSPSTSHREDLLLLPSAPGNFQVRNTFIHIEATPVDARQCQSMPHGMFRQCMLAESLHEVAHCEPSPADAGYDTASEPDEYMTGQLLNQTDQLLNQPGELYGLSIGTLVVIEGLVKAPAFNGRSGVVQGWDEMTARYEILLASPEGCQQAKIKEDNLRVVLPCP